MLRQSSYFWVSPASSHSARAGSCVGGAESSQQTKINPPNPAFLQGPTGSRKPEQTFQSRLPPSAARPPLSFREPGLPPAARASSRDGRCSRPPEDVCLPGAFDSGRALLSCSDCDNALSPETKEAASSLHAATFSRAAPCFRGRLCFLRGLG